MFLMGSARKCKADFLAKAMHIFTNGLYIQPDSLKIEKLSTNGGKIKKQFASFRCILFPHAPTNKIKILKAIFTRTGNLPAQLLNIPIATHLQYPHQQFYHRQSRHRREFFKRFTRSSTETKFNRPICGKSTPLCRHRK